MPSSRASERNWYPRWKTSTSGAGPGGARLVEPDPRLREARDVQLDLEAGQVRVAELAQAPELGTQLRTSVQRQRPPVPEVGVADHPTGAIRPRQHAKRARVGNDHDVGEARELVDAEAAALDEHGREYAIPCVEAEDRSGEVGTAPHRRDRALAGEVLAARDAVLVDEDQAHRPQPELLDPSGDLGRSLGLLVRVQPVAIDEAGRPESQPLTHPLPPRRRRGDRTPPRPAPTEGAQADTRLDSFGRIGSPGAPPGRVR